MTDEQPHQTYHSGAVDPLTYQPISFDFLFTGHLYHAKSGLYFAPFRAYDPTLGRWISRDPIDTDGGINLYAYVEGDPVNAVDPWGLWIIRLRLIIAIGFEVRFGYDDWPISITGCIMHIRMPDFIVLAVDLWTFGGLLGGLGAIALLTVGERTKPPSGRLN